MSTSDVSYTAPENLTDMYSKDSYLPLGQLFLILREKIIDPYREKMGLQEDELYLNWSRNNVLFIKGRVNEELIDFFKIIYPDNVEIIDNRYEDLETELREKLAELQKNNEK